MGFTILPLAPPTHTQHHHHHHHHVSSRSQSPDADGDIEIDDADRPSKRAKFSSSANGDRRPPVDEVITYDRLQINSSNLSFDPLHSTAIHSFIPRILT